MSETSDVVRPILDALAKVPGVVAWRCQSGTVKVRGAWMHLAPEGTPDIIGFRTRALSLLGDHGEARPAAVFFGIECKKTGNTTAKKRAEKQAAWGKRLVEHGGIYVVARSVAEALAGLGLG